MAPFCFWDVLFSVCLVHLLTHSLTFGRQTLGSIFIFDDQLLTDEGPGFVRHVEQVIDFAIALEVTDCAQVHSAI